MTPWQSGYHGLRRGATVARLAVLATLLLAVPIHSAATEAVAPPALPGVGGSDPRVIVDPAVSPWRAVGRLQTEGGNRCTGFLTGPTTVLTAAHCLYNHRTRHFTSAEEVHFLIGYQGGDYTGHAIASSYVIGKDYDPARPMETLGDDWAIVTLAAPLGTPERVLSPLPDAAKPPQAAMLGGYGQDHAELINADRHCAVTGEARDAGGRMLLTHSCSATRGTSGAPLLIPLVGGKWAVAGIQVAAQMGRQDGIAVPIGRVTRSEAHTPE